MFGPRLTRSTIIVMLTICALASPASAQKKSSTKKPAATPTAAAAPKTRMEHDLLGNKEVPFDAYYGVQTARALENFQLSGIAINRYPGYVEAWAIVKLAAARANTAVGAMKPERLTMIEKACQAVRDGKYHDQFQVDWYQGGAGTSTNMNANEVLANVGLELGGHKKGEYQYLEPHDDLNMSQSTNDSYPTAIKVALILRNAKLIDELQKLADAFHAKRSSCSRTPRSISTPRTWARRRSAPASTCRRDTPRSARRSWRRLRASRS
jgi:aspartate ammonia-lyase